MWTRRASIRTFLGLVGVSTFPAALRAKLPIFTPERFGAKGDGRTDDSDAFAALSDAINASGGGRIMLRRTTYLVGTVGADLAVRRLLAIRGCTHPVRIEGNGAILRCAPGQRFGAFTQDLQPIEGRPRKGDGRRLMRPYAAMVLVENCSGSLTIENLELDGTSGALVLGGRHGDTGWQIGCWGLGLRNNSGSERVVNVHAHDQAQDGFYIDGVDSDAVGFRRELIKLRSSRNARQGLSLVGGRDYTISDSVFEQTGRNRFGSAPAAGVDIEAQQRKQIRRIDFKNCRFVDNRGCGLVADSGDSADLRFLRCSFVGTSDWSAWARKPGMVFEKCLFVGSIVHGFSDPDPRRATRFTDCTFTNDPALSPTGIVRLRKNLIADLPRAQNVLFERCRFDLHGSGVLPWSVGPIWKDCTMSQESKQVAHTRGTFRGTNRITGPVAIAHSRIEGPLYLNGVLLKRSTGASLSDTAV
ncbi:MAG: hypothetical protein EOO81_03420 [Oxalobacteraceae bacterium]|nr:MAG: hypothetical protein EOO81_03420 [Oxalobacteraceae bacterium]